MKPEPEKDAERITQWFDGELSDEQIADLLAADPALVEQKAAAAGLGNLLRSELREEHTADIPHGDFFSHRLKERILDEQKSASPSAAAEGISLREEAQVLPLFTRLRYAAGLAFVLMLASVIAYGLFSGNDAMGSEVLSTYTPDPSVTATTRYSADAGATIIELEGVEEIPASRILAGISPSSYEPCGDFGRTVLTDIHNGHPLLALAIDANGRPEFTALRF